MGIFLWKKGKIWGDIPSKCQRRVKLSWLSEHSHVLCWWEM